MTTWIRSSYSFANSNCVEVAWRKASGSAALQNCVEVGWQKAAACSNGTCVEVCAPHPAAVAVRDSKDPEGPVLVFGREAWDAFLAGLKAGELARP